VDVRLVGMGEPGVRALPEALEQVRSILGAMIYGEDDETLEACVISEMTTLGATLALAESCTGGFVAHRLTNVPGASAVLKSGWVTYSNRAKVTELGVSESDLMLHGAVSEPIARQMAEGALRQSGATFAVALTGIAGPGGGTAEKPVGTVYIAVAGPGSTRVTRGFNPFDRETFKLLSAQEALNNLRAFYLGNAASDLSGVR
jgi:nicotinamide-nucleotide amidase